VFKFLLTPRWIALTLVFLLALPAFDALSQWQWRRLHQRQQYNGQIEKAQSLPPIDESLLVRKTSHAGGADTYSFPPSAQWRAVQVTGTWDASEQVLVRKKSLESDLGFWVVTPLVTTDGHRILINRGWTAAIQGALDSPTVRPAPQGKVQVAGRVQIVQPRQNPQPIDLPKGQVDTVVPTEIVTTAPVVNNAYLEMTASRPNSLTTELREIPGPEITEGPHRSYALQWIFFAIMTVIGWVVLVRNEYLTRLSATKLEDTTA
jgi:cytochrome oxidase assembly protein ShyY1